MIQEDFDQAFDQVIANALGPKAPSRISDDMDLLEMGVESLQLIQIIMQLEDEFNVFWPVEQLAEYEKFTSIGALRHHCRDLQETAPGRGGGGDDAHN